MTDDAGEASYSVYGPAGLERRVAIERAPLTIDGLSVTEFVMLGLTSSEMTTRVEIESTRVYVSAYPAWSGSSTTRTTDLPDRQVVALGTAHLKAGHKLSTFPVST